MIFVTFGNGPMPFERLAAKVDELAGRMDEEFIVQYGHTRYHFTNVRALQFLSSSEMENFIEDSSIVVTHGGYGTISECLKKGKRVIAVPRVKGIENNHPQDELVKALEALGCIIGVYDISDLENSISKAREFEPKPLPKGNINQVINEFIKKVFPEK